MKSANYKNSFFVVYYLLLVMLFMSWTDFHSVPGAIVRLLYLAALLVPVYFFNKRMLPAVMALFLSISTHGFTSSYMPAMMYTYVVLMPIGLVFFKPLSFADKKDVLRLLFILFLYITVVNFLTSFEFHGISEALIIALCMLCYIDMRDEDLLHIMSGSFMIASLALSFSFLVWGDQVGSVMMYEEERAGFHDINYSSCVVSLGCIAAVIELFNKSKNKLFFILCVATLALSFVALLLNASRASLLSVALVFVLMAFTSKTRVIYKLIIVAVVAYGLWFLYTNEFFAILEKRMEMESGGGSGRFDIWRIKFHAFFNESNFLQLLFGWGYTDGRNLEISKLRTLGFHNDYLAFLVEYGIIGGIMFMYMFFYPLWYSFKKRNNFYLVGAISAGLFVICFTLEPFAAGRIPFFFFWIYMMWWAKIKLPAAAHPKV